MNKGDKVLVLHEDPAWFNKEGTVTEVTGDTVMVEVPSGSWSYIGSFQLEQLRLLKSEVFVANTIDMPSFTTINEALRFDYEMKKPKYDPFQDMRVRNGLCPQCGEKGRYHMSVPICPEHGPY